MKKITLICLLLLFGVSAHSLALQSDDFFVGQWDVEVKDTPNGTVKVVLSLERVDGKLSGKFVDATTGRETKISQINEQEKSITLYFFAEGYDLYLTLKPESEDQVSGSLADSFMVSGQRIKG
ncbi:hypothetical protein [Algoriphagus sp. AK58]|uniref:hypothetical protein n=1 Tax=Algoriphagus sp. AK58 TaxID=1406877 RepID=UPI0016508864|nr:hypothetical protein [Algoriphagus sp. AK58]MBC6367841.1 hypothetical protein [Algoriphagus sp. AK58]